MEVLVLDGKSYVKASKAAKDLGYATDYVGQLCRGGKVDAHLIGRTWYVNKDELSTHRTEKKRMSRVKAREYAKRSIEDYKQKSTNIYKNIDIRYESDAGALLPETKNLKVTSEPVRKEFAYEDRVDGDEMEVLNKGEHVVMSGNIEVQDVTDGPADTETTFLSPKIVRSPRPERLVVNKQEILEAVHGNIYDEVDIEKIIQNDVVQELPQRMSFIDRLEIPKDQVVVETGEVSEVEVSAGDIEIKPALATCVVLLTVLILLVFNSFLIIKTTDFTHLGGTTAIERSSYNWSTDLVAQVLGLKI
ncbi:MAG: hypothetical protein NUW00_05450 [Candidatus Kaiserbacteria bacterium]|nr:hypothetical protein [Candidatus Kaiserbacteria bacterium]